MALPSYQTHQSVDNRPGSPAGIGTGHPRPIYSWPTLEGLQRRGGHFLRCRGTGPKPKAPAEGSRRWQLHPLTRTELKRAWTDRTLLGLIPASVGCSVLDLDGAGVGLEGFLPPPHAAGTSMSGQGRHLVYDAAPGLTMKPCTGNDGQHLGEGVGSRAYVVLTPETLRAFANANKLSRRGHLAPFPEELLTSSPETPTKEPTPPHQPPQNDRTAPQPTFNDRQQGSQRQGVAPEGWWRTPAPIAATEGHRNVTLFDLLLAATAWNHQHWETSPAS